MLLLLQYIHVMLLFKLKKKKSSEHIRSEKSLKKKKTPGKHNLNRKQVTHGDEITWSFFWVVYPKWQKPFLRDFFKAVRLQTEWPSWWKWTATTLTAHPNIIAMLLLLVTETGETVLLP